MGGLTRNLKALFFDIIPMEETYFLKTDKPATSVNNELVKINFSHLSPFQNSALSYYADERFIYIWFIRNKDKKKKVLIPESYILFKRYSKENKDVLIKKRISKNKFCFLIIKEGSLVSQITSSKNITLEIVRKKYSLSENTEFVEIDTINHNKVKLIELLSFLNPRDIFELDMKKVASKIYEQIKIPLVILFFTLNSVNFIFYKYISHLLNIRKSELKRLILQNKNIRMSFEKLNESAVFFRNFIRNELPIPSGYKVTTSVYKALLSSNSVILIYNQIGSRLLLTVSTQNAPEVINSLMKTGMFRNITVISATQERANKTILNLDVKINSFLNLEKKKDG